MKINNKSIYYIPESFTAENITYTDENVEAEDIRPIVLPFVPTNKITTAKESCFFTLYHVKNSLFSPTIYELCQNYTILLLKKLSATIISSGVVTLMFS